MAFKSEKWSSNQKLGSPGANSFRWLTFTISTLSLFFFVMAMGALGLGNRAQAAPEVEPTAPWVLSDGIVHYLISGSEGEPNLDVREGFTSKSLTASAAHYSSINKDMLRFDVTVNKSGNNLILAVFARAGSEYYAVPISGYNSGVCGGGTNCKYLLEDLGVAPDVHNKYYFAIPVSTGQKITIGLYARDICYGGTLMGERHLGGIDPTGCKNRAVDVDPGETDPIQMDLFFVVLQDPGNFENAISQFVLKDRPDDSTRIVMRFHEKSIADAGGGELKCTLKDSYYPGDSNIALNRQNFVFSGAHKDAAPVQWILVAADRKALKTGPVAFTKNEVVGVVPYGRGEARIDGFKNATDGVDNAYTIGFAARDAAGVLSGEISSLNTANCSSMFPLRTATVEGFLSESQCFMATAAFRSAHSPEVMFLRKFRDEVLLTNSPGRYLVDAYYRYSPLAAKWLINHPEYRGIVLYGLLPVLSLAWLALNPWVLLPSILAAVGIFVFCGYEGSRRKIKDRFA